MTLTHPWALALAAIAAPIVLAYLHRLHRDRRTVSSALLLRVVRDDRPASRRSRSRLRHKLSLLLMLLALLAALIALIGPRTSSGEASRLILVIDTSASMGTRDGGGTRLDRAADRAVDLAERAGDGEEVALITAGAVPAIEMAPTRDHGDVATAALAVARRGAHGDNHDDALAFQLADGLCRDAEHTRLVVISDGAGLTVPPTRCKVLGESIGRDDDNVGITGLSAHPLDGLGLYEIHVAVASSAHTDRHVEVTLTVDGALVDVVSLMVPAQGDAQRSVRVPIEHGRHLVATLPGGDALALDDRAELDLGDDGPVSVLLVTNHKQSLVAEALRLHPRVQLAIATKTLPAEHRDLIVLESEPEAPLPPASHVVALGVNPGEGAPISLGGQAEERAVVRWDFDAPWFQFVDLRNVIIGNAHLVAGGRPVVDTGSGALVAAASWGARELLVTGFSLDETDLTLRAAFPNLIANLVEWAAPGTQGGPPIGVLSAAETHIAPRPLPGGLAVATSAWNDAPWLARLAVLLAVALLLVEQALYLRGRTA